MGISLWSAGFARYGPSTGVAIVPRSSRLFRSAYRRYVSIMPRQTPKIEVTWERTDDPNGEQAVVDIFKLLLKPRGKGSVDNEI